MGTMRVLGKGGDQELPFNKSTFEKQINKGLLAFTIPAEGQEAQQTDQFDPTAHEIVFARPLAGG